MYMFGSVVNGKSLDPLYFYNEMKHVNNNEKNAIETLQQSKSNNYILIK